MAGAVNAARNSLARNARGLAVWRIVSRIRPKRSEKAGEHDSPTPHANKREEEAYAISGNARCWG